MSTIIAFGFGLLIVASTLAAEPVKAAPTAELAMSPAVASSQLSLLALPGAPADGVLLDYLAVDRPRHRVWVPAGGTGNVVVIDTKTQEIRTVEKFATKEVERRGQKRMVGLSSATVGDGVVYVGNRADSSACAVDAKTLERRDCVTLSGSPDGLAFVARTKEVWVTTPHDQAIVILDVSKPSSPKLAGSFKLEGEPEGYAVDDNAGLFYTNLEDKDRTLRIDVSMRKVTATWMPECGEDGPKGLAYVAAGRAATLTVAHVDDKGVLTNTAKVATATGARNAVVSQDGTAYIADGREGKILVARPSHAN